MKKVSSVFLSLVLVCSASSAFAQTKKKAKAKAKTSTAKPVAEKIPEPAPATPSTEISPELTAPPPAATSTPEAAAVPTTPMTGAPEAAAPTTPAETKPYTAAAGSPHLFGLSAAVGLPHPMRLGFDYVHSSRLFSIGAAYGAFSISAADVKLAMTNMELALRWHPFSGSFFLGALLGNHTISAEQSKIISSSNITGKLEVKANYAAPYMGWMWGGASTGFFAGLDFGFMSPSGVTSTFTSNAGAPIVATTDYQTMESDIRKAGDAFGAIGVPMFTLLKLGWMF